MHKLVQFVAHECNGDIEKIKENVSRKKELELGKLKGDASSRSYYRLRKERESVIIMALPDGEPKSDEGESKTTSSQRLPFVEIQELLSQIGIRVPEIFYVHEDKGVLVLEDLGDLTLYSLLESGENMNKRVWYAKAIMQMAVMHQAGTAYINTHKSIVGRRVFDEKLYRWEFEHFSEYGLYTHECYRGQKKSPSASQRKQLASIYDSISQRIFALEKVFTHRDFHSRNLMITGGELVNIDFQDALLAPRGYDLASLLYDAYVDLNGEERQEFIEMYGNASHFSVSLTQALAAEVHLTAIQRTLKAAGRFEFLKKVKGNGTLAPFIPNALANAKAALSFFPEFIFLNEMIEKYSVAQVA